VLDDIRSLLREPLLHFLLGGAGLFLLFSFVSDSERAANDEIIVSAGQIEHMEAVFRKTRQRNPTNAELDGLIDNFIVEEVLYREAITIGLDVNDTIIRRRLRQKMEFLLDDFTLVEPSDADLQQFLDNNPDRFRADGLISFRQIYLNEFSRTKAEELLLELQADTVGRPEEQSESYLLPYQFEDASEAAISAQFGNAFQQALFALDPGRWNGPVESPFGIHLVWIDSIVAGRVPPLQDIRKEVDREWLADFRQAAQGKILEQLRSRYTVTIERPGGSQP
jgi:hypothetical protein